MINVALFDLDDTLFQGNSTFEFIEFVNRKNSNYQLFRARYRYLKFFNKITVLVFRYDWYKRKSVMFLKGKTEAEIRELCEQFYTQQLEKKKINPVHDLLLYYQKNNYKVVLVTATLDVIAKEVAKNLSIEHQISTELVMESGKCVGTYQGEKLYQKENSVKEFADLSTDNIVFFSDNKQDIKLLKKVSFGALIVYE